MNLVSDHLTGHFCDKFLPFSNVFEQVVCDVQLFFSSQLISFVARWWRGVHALKAYPKMTYVLAHLNLLPGQKDAESDEEHACGKVVSDGLGGCYKWQWSFVKQMHEWILIALTIHFFFLFQTQSLWRRKHLNLFHSRTHWTHCCSCCCFIDVSVSIKPNTKILYHLVATSHSLSESAYQSASVSNKWKHLQS